VIACELAPSHPVPSDYLATPFSFQMLKLSLHANPQAFGFHTTSGRMSPG
jgi:hypothetical protein